MILKPLEPFDVDRVLALPPDGFRVEKLANRVSFARQLAATMGIATPSGAADAPDMHQMYMYGGAPPPQQQQPDKGAPHASISRAITLSLVEQGPSIRVLCTSPALGQ